ncbi:hypothetical protein PTKIN_Ptkin18bG0155800 [Pterospermum kingtungense]
MKFLSWNARVEKGKEYASRWGYSHCEGVSSRGNSGGLLILWDAFVDVSIKSMNENILNLASMGQLLTWTNNHDGDDVLWERLDRGFANGSWFDKYANAYLHNYPVADSDHGPMIISTSKDLPTS